MRNKRRYMYFLCMRYIDDQTGSTVFSCASHLTDDPVNSPDSLRSLTDHAQRTYARSAKRGTLLLTSISLMRKPWWAWHV